jgi:hypothetical protein
MVGIVQIVPECIRAAMLLRPRWPKKKRMKAPKAGTYIRQVCSTGGKAM